MENFSVFSFLIRFPVQLLLQTVQLFHCFFRFTLFICGLSACLPFLGLAFQPASYEEKSFLLILISRSPGNTRLKGQDQDHKHTQTTGHGCYLYQKTGKIHRHKLQKSKSH